MLRSRAYRSPLREAAAAETRKSILLAARDLLRGSAETPTVGAIAAQAGVSRLSVYHHFGSHAGVLAAVAEVASAAAPAPGTALHEFLAASVAHWAADPRLFRRLAEPPLATHELASRLGAEDRLRPGCSLKEAEDVLAVIASFATFDRLHQNGRRSSAAVTEILMRMAGSILNPQA